MSEPKCWFYQAKVQDYSSFAGAFRPHLLWLDGAETILIFYVEQGIPKSTRFDTISLRFSSPKSIDFSALGIEIFDYAIQRVFLFQSRLLIVRHCTAGEKHPMMMSDSHIQKLYPIKLTLDFDLCYNGLAFDGCDMFVFGGLSFATGQTQNELYQISMCTLKVQKIKCETTTIPPPRLEPFLEIFGTEIYITSGQERLSCTSTASTLNDMWCFSLRKSQWIKVNIPSIDLSGIKSVCADKEKMVLLSKHPQASCQILKIPSLQVVKIFQSSNSRIPLGVG